MPKDLSLNLIAAKNELNQDDPWLALLDIVLPDATHLRLVNNTENITFGGNVYTAFPFSLGVNKYESNSTIPGMILEMSNVTGALQQYLEFLDGAVDSDITITIVNAGLLTEDYSELQITFKVISTTVTSTWATFNLGAPNPLRQRYPLYVYLASMCNWVSNYKGVECAYTGGLGTCGGTWDDCEARGNTARYGGFKGLNQEGFKLAK